MVQIDKQLYYIDLEAIDAFVFKEHEDVESGDVETITTPKGVVQQTTNKRDNSDKFANIRYDLVKAMLDATYNSGVESEEGNIKYLQDIEEMSLGTKLIFNTMIVHGFIKNKLD